MRRMAEQAGRVWRTGSSDDRGIALLMVLWVIVVLMVIAFSFSVLARTEANSTLSFRNDAEKRLLAEAALERALMEIIFRMSYQGQMQIEEEREVFRVDGKEYSEELGKGRYALRITDESGKINLNKMTDFSGIILNNLLVNMGLDKEKADIIVDSILDWKDGDDLHRLHGAEDEYYQSLPVPYKAKNGPLDTLEELLRIRGVTREILYGTKERPGIINFVTLYGTSEKINLNAAPMEVLRAIPEMTDDIVNRILEQRDSKEYSGAAEAASVAGENLQAISRYTDITESNTYSVEAIGYTGGEKRGFGIRAVVTLDAGTKFKYVYYKSPAEIRQ